ncbi:aminopeptidase N-like [Camponotus floridanus]|nr:aminopeptidase N-like [Camponotus floridanus]XP_025265951.1 aminopeptidase N-like [Camponotus floridanus]
MTILKVLSCSLIFIVAAVPFIDAEYKPRHYNIHFILYDIQEVFRGEYNVSIYIPDDTQHLYFYTENLYIITTTITNNTQISKENEGKDFPHRPKKFIYDIETYITTISFPYILSSGCYTLYMKFSGFFGENGGFRTFYNQQNDRVSLAATHYHTFGIRRLFPLLKDSMYASYNISIKHHVNYTALSNMPMWEENVDENNMQWTRFETTPVIPVHFIAASVVHLGFILDTSQSAKLWCGGSMEPHMIFAYTVVIIIEKFSDNVFPYRKSPETNHIAIPKFCEVLDEENIKFGFVLYREADIIFNQKTDDEMRKIEIVRVISYKVMHERISNAIDKWQPWLSKGLSTFFGIYAANETFPHFRIQDFFVVQMQHDVLHWGTKDTWPLTIESGFNSSFEIPRYIKASIMFRTLQIISPKKMLHTYMKYLRDHSYDTMFLNIVQSDLNESFGNHSFDIDRITNWTQLNYYPVINVQRNYNTNLLNIYLLKIVENFTNIWIHVNITTQTYSNLKKILPILWLGPNNSHQLQITDFINQSDWVLANLQQSGCYRVNYDVKNWKRLSKYLNSKSYRTIHVLDRAKIIDDTFHFVMTGRLNFTIFLNISHYLWQDTDYIAWYPMFKNLEYISGFFAFPESVPRKKEIIEPLNLILSEIKYPNFKSNITQESVFTKCLRQEAARWLCNIGLKHCLLQANNELKSYFFNRTNFSPTKIWIEWKEWTFCNGLMIEDDNIWMQVYDMYLKESDYSILKFLACSKNASIIRQYMHLMANMTNVTAIDRISSFCTIVARHAKNVPVLDFILDNLEKIKPKEIGLVTALTIIINHVYAKEHIVQIKNYVQINFKEDLKFAIYYHDMVIQSYLKNFVETMIYKIIMKVNRKLELRWNQIRSQLHKYRYLIKNYDYILKEDLAD